MTEIVSDPSFLYPALPPIHLCSEIQAQGSGLWVMEKTLCASLSLVLCLFLMADKHVGHFPPPEASGWRVIRAIWELGTFSTKWNLDWSESWGRGLVGNSVKLRFEQKTHFVILLAGRVTKVSEATFLPSKLMLMTAVSLGVVINHSIWDYCPRWE